MHLSWTKLNYIHKDITNFGCLVIQFEGKSKRKVLSNGNILEHMSTCKSTLRNDDDLIV